MGDRIAIMQVGGKLAQFGPPAEILAAPASEFVARFVGTDRSLKRLSLFRVGDLQLERPVVAHTGDDAAAVKQHVKASQHGYVLLVDEDDRPISWIAEAEIPTSGRLGAAMGTPAEPILDRRTTLKDALALLLDADVQAGLVVDRRGSLRGMVRLFGIAAFVQEREIVSSGVSLAEDEELDQVATAEEALQIAAAAVAGVDGSNGDGANARDAAPPTEAPEPGEPATRA